MGSTWETVIRAAKFLLDSMFHQQGHTRLTHEVFTTLMVEVASISNAKLLVIIFINPDEPPILHLPQAFPSADVKVCKIEVKISQKCWHQIPFQACFKNCSPSLLEVIIVGIFLHQVGSVLSSYSILIVLFLHSYSLLVLKHFRLVIIFSASCLDIRKYQQH